MKTIAILNLKGGTAKTVTAATMARCLSAEHDKQVLLIDADQQGNLSQYFGVTDASQCGNTWTLLTEGAGYWPDFVTTISPTLDLIPSGMELARADLPNSGVKVTQIEELRTVLAEDNLDFLIIDLPPSLGTVVQAALLAADEVIIPIRPDTFSTAGMAKLAYQVDSMRRVNPRIRIAGILGTQYQRTAYEREVHRLLLLESGLPVFQTLIRMSPPVPKSFDAHESILTFSPAAGPRKTIGPSWRSTWRGAMDDFVLADVLRGQLQNLSGNVSKLDTSAGREQIEYIDISKIDADPRNFYALSGLDELVANIELVGLQQPLRVRENPETPGRVVIVSGHRRRAALQKLVDEGETAFRDVPCIREQESGSSAFQELRLIHANSGTRILSSAELSRQVERVEQLLYQLKVEEGMEFPGRMRDYVAEICKISAPKLARLKIIREKLVPQYMGLFEKDKLPEQTAYALARLPEDFQKRLANALSDIPSGNVAEKVLKKYEEGWRWEPDLQCPDGKPCKRGDTFLRRDCEAHYWESFCGGNTCCLKCKNAKAEYSPCERMCSKAKAQRKAKKDAEAEAAHKRKQKNGRTYQKETQIYAKRLLPAIDAAGLPEEESVRWNWDSCTVADIRRWAAGEFDDPAEWRWARLEPGKCGKEVEVATLLGCTTDFLMGLTDNFRPSAAPEPPAQEGPTQNVSNLDTLPEGEPEEEPEEELEEELEEEAGEEEPPVRRVRWESRGRTPPEGKPILTYEMTNDGPVYRPAVWEGGQFKSPNGKRVLSGLQYSQWLEVPPPGSSEAFQLEQAEGQLAISGWMPGSSLPWEPCEVVADFRIPGEGTESEGTLRRGCWFDGENFLFKRYGAKIDVECIRWMVLPPVDGDVSNLDTNGGERT